MIPISSALIETEIKDSFSIRFLADKHYDSPSTYRLTYNRIFLVHSGSGEIIIDDNIFEISSSELFLIAKGQVISFQVGAEFTGYELSFGDCFWEKAPSSANNCKAVLFNNASANQLLPLGKEDHDELNFLFKSLLQEFSNKEYAELLYVSSVFHDLGLTKHYSSPDLRFEVDGANAARDFLKSHGCPKNLCNWYGIQLPCIQQ